MKNRSSSTKVVERQLTIDTPTLGGMSFSGPGAVRDSVYLTRAGGIDRERASNTEVTGPAR